MREALDQLKSRLATIADLHAASAVLEWDQETYMPPGAAMARAHQIGTLRKLAHEQFTEDALGTLLDQADADLDGNGSDGDGFDAALLRETRRDYDRARKLPTRLVTEMAEATSHAREAWKEAKDTDTFATFAPHLQRVLDLNREKAEAYGFEDQAYDALLDEFEPGMKTATLVQVFADLRAALVPLVHAIAEQPAPDAAFLRRRFDPQKQWDFGVEVIRAFGYDFAHGRQDHSAHPFTTTFAISDVRLTTRVQPDFFNPAFFGTLHEAGHGLYEQGVDPALARTPLASGTSLGMHESQSRLWENLVGRSRPFWGHYYPQLRATFPDALGGVSEADFFRAINRVAPSLIRVEADEVTYNLHIMLRFELELDLLEGRVAVADLPDAWNARMEEYLGLTPPDDTRGVLQDIHWSLGTFGYFPTYSLGNLMSTQLFAAARRDLGDLDGQIGAGEFGPLLGWLRENVHQWGRAKTALEILEGVTGEGLSAESWLAYVRTKYGALYDGLTTLG